MDIIHSGLWFVSGLGSAVFAATHRPTRISAALFVALFIVGGWWTRLAIAPSPALLGCLVAVVAADALFRSSRPRLLAGVAGLLAGLWVGPLQSSGAPLWLALVVALAVPLMAATLRIRHARFAPPILRDEALLFLVILSLIVAAAPTVVEGWRAAGALKIAAGAPDSMTSLPTWTVTLSIAALLAGGVSSVWSRR